MATFNVHDGFEESLVRGFRSGFVTHQQYAQLMDLKEGNGGSLEDIKLNLQETEYGRFLGDHSGKLEVGDLVDAMLDKLAEEFQYFRSLGSAQLGKFLDYITYEYMIENVMLILRASSGGNVNINEILEQCHPLGRFDDSVLKSIATFENSTESYQELYSTVLVETPIGPYFERFLIEQSEKQRNMRQEDMRNMLEETPATILENSLLKMYMEDFYAFCKGLGGETATCMCEILEARADAMSISITLNSFGTPLCTATGRMDRAMLYPSFGTLYPALLDDKRDGPGLVTVSNEAELKAALQKNSPTWRNLFREMAQSGKSFDDILYRREVRLCELAFEGQFHYGAFYAYVRLKEQEIRNIEWIANTTALAKPEIMKEHFLPIFWPESPWRTGQEAEQHAG
eukprot:g3356.t1